MRIYAVDNNTGQKYCFFSRQTLNRFYLQHRSNTNIPVRHRKTVRAMLRNLDMTRINAKDY